MIALGPQSQGAVAAFGPAGWHGSDMAAVQAQVLAAVQAGVASVVVKGSRSMRMEQVVQALQAASAQQGAGVC